jgi:hypothetical protein
MKYRTFVEIFFWTSIIIMWIIAIYILNNAETMTNCFIAG